MEKASGGSQEGSKREHQNVDINPPKFGYCKDEPIERKVGLYQYLESGTSKKTDFGVAEAQHTIRNTDFWDRNTGSNTWSHPELSSLKITRLWDSIVFTINLKTPEDNNTCTQSLKQFDTGVLQFIVIEAKSVTCKFKETFGDEAKISISGNKLKLTIDSTNTLSFDKVKSSAVRDLEEVGKQIKAHELLIRSRDPTKLLSLISSDIVPMTKRNRSDLYLQGDRKLIVVGFEAEFDELYRSVTDKLNSAQKVPFKGCNAEAFTKLRMGVILDYSFPEVKYNILEEKECIEFQGEKEEISQCILLFKENIAKIKKRKKLLSQNYIDLLQTNETKKFIYEELDKKSITCYYEIDAVRCTLTTWSSMESKSEDAIKCIVECFLEKTFNLEDDEYAIVSRPEFKDFLSEHKNRKLLMHSKEGMLNIFATTDIMRKLNKKVNKFIKKKESEKIKTMSVYKHFPSSQIDKRSTQQDVEYMDIDYEPDLGTNQDIYCDPENQISYNIEITHAFIYLMKNNTELKSNFDVMLKQIPNASLRSNMNGQFVHLEGNKTDVEKGNSKVIDFFQERLFEDSFEIAEACHVFIKSRKHVRYYVTDAIRKRGIISYWRTYSIDDKFFVRVTGLDKKHVSDTVVIIKSCLHKMPFSVKINASLQKRLNEVAEELKEKMLLDGNYLGSNQIDVYTTADFAEEVRNKIQAIIIPKLDEFYTEKFYTRKEKIEFSANSLQKIVEQYGLHKDNLTCRPEYSTVEIKGPAEDVPLISEEAQQYLSKLHISCIVLNGNEGLSSDDDLFQQIAKENLCRLKIEERKLLPAYCFIGKEKKVHIELVCGRTTDMEVDVAVCPTNECLFSIGSVDDMLKDDETLMTLSQRYLSSTNKQIGETFFVDASPAYMCRSVALAVFEEEKTKTDPIKGIKNAILRLMDKCFTSGVQSIAIPLQIFEYQSAKLQAETILSGIKESISKKTFVPEIYLCLLEPCHLKMCCEEAVEIFHPSYESLDWRPFNDYRIVKQGGNSEIITNVVEGELVDQKADILVNTVGTHLDLRKGYVSRTILERGGQIIQQECSKGRPDGIKIGQVIVTSAGNLKTCKNICHGALPGWIPKVQLSLKVLKLFMWQCLTVAAERNYHSIAFPALGTGNLQYPHHAVADTMFEVVEDFGRQNIGTSLRKVDIVVFPKDQRTVEVFRVVENKWKNRHLEKKEEDVGLCRILEIKCPLDVGTVCLQILPLSTYKTVEEKLIMKFAKEKKPTAEYRDGFNKDVLMLYADPSDKLKNVIEDCLLESQRYRITSIAIILEDNKLSYIQRSIKTIRGILDYRNIPYLHLVRIYIQDSRIYEELVRENIIKSSMEERQGWTFSYAKKTALAMFRPKELPPWRTVYLKGNVVQECLVIYGKSDDVTRTRKKIMGHLQNRQPQKVWFYYDKTGTKREFHPDISKRLSLGLSNLNDTEISMKDERNQEWIFDVKKMICKTIIPKEEYKLYEDYKERQTPTKKEVCKADKVETQPPALDNDDLIIDINVTYKNKCVNDNEMVKKVVELHKDMILKSLQTFSNFEDS